jgi:putative glutamine amidotransferase
MSQPPLIAVVGRHGAPGRLSRDAVAFAGYRYLESLLRAGGEPVVLTPRPLDHAEACSLLERFDGMLLMGGPDVDPASYGADPHPAVYGVHPDQDRFEIHMVRAALEVEVPTLAICRGIQVVNVALGGTLIPHLPDVPGHIDHAPQKFPAGVDGVMHGVKLEPGSRVATAMRSTEIIGASFHHQGIDRVGDGLEVVGRSPDGLTEALEYHRDSMWLLGVQWHPEDTADRDPEQQALYDALVAEAASRRSGGGAAQANARVTATPAG